MDVQLLYGFKFNKGKRLHRDVKQVKVIVIHAGFGDATLIEVTDHQGKEDKI